MPSTLSRSRLEHWPITQLGHARSCPARHPPSVAGAISPRLLPGLFINIASPGQTRRRQFFQAPLPCRKDSARCRSGSASRARRTAETTDRTDQALCYQGGPVIKTAKASLCRSGATSHLRISAQWPREKSGVQRRAGGNSAARRMSQSSCSCPCPFKTWVRAFRISSAQAPPSITAKKRRYRVSSATGFHSLPWGSGSTATAKVPVGLATPAAAHTLRWGPFHPLLDNHGCFARGHMVSAYIWAIEGAAGIVGGYEYLRPSQLRSGGLVAPAWPTGCVGAPRAGHAHASR